MKILLINPPCRRAVEMPLGLAYIASVLRLSGHNINLLDINASGISQDKVVGILKNTDFNVIGIGGLTSTYKYVKWLSSVIKNIKPEIPIIAGNMVSTAIPELLLNNTKIDIAVIDEGEETVKDLIETIARSGDLSCVDGIYFKKEDQIYQTKPRKRIEDIDSLPFPAWDLFPIDIYLKSTIHIDYGYRSMSMSTVRGCPFSCIYCSRPFGRKVYARSAESMVKEIKELKNKFGVQYIGFADDLFLFDEARILEFCDRLIKERIDIKWGGSGRANLVNEKLLVRMKRAGCICLGYGFESGSQKILDIMNKNVTVKQAEEAIKMTRKAGIYLMSSFMFGMVGETEETIKETIDFMKKMRIPDNRLLFTTPFPKTPLYELSKKMGRLPEDEDKYIESLGELYSTCLVNLTNFSKDELVKLKKQAEAAIWKNFSVSMRFQRFWQTVNRSWGALRLEYGNKAFLIIFLVMPKTVFLKIKGLIKNANNK